MQDQFSEDPVEKRKVKPTIEEVAAALQTSDSDHVPASAFYGLSDMSLEDVEQFMPVWDKLATDYRAKILTELAEASETNFEFEYNALARLGLADLSFQVRVSALSLLWADESPELLAKLLLLAETDESVAVRAASASEIGRFILLGEYAEIPERDALRAQETMLELYNDETEDIEVRRRALEAISNSSYEYLAEAITQAYASDEVLMRVSAVFAMGRSYDQQWSDTVLKELYNDDPEIRYEAARAAGELEIEESVSLLGKMAQDDDRDIQLVAIWSLGEIGGAMALRILNELAEEVDEADEDLQDAIEDAIGFAALPGADFDFELDD